MITKEKEIKEKVEFIRSVLINHLGYAEKDAQNAIDKMANMTLKKENEKRSALGENQ